MGSRLICIIASVATCAIAVADWTATPVHPTAGFHSSLVAISGNLQAGFILATPGLSRAGLWNGTGESFTSLHPMGADESYLRGASATKQFGYIRQGSDYRGGMWSGTAASWVNLHPTGARASYVLDADGAKQVGYVTNVSFQDRAGIWSGTAESFVSLHPASASASVARAISGNSQGGYVQLSEEPNAAIWYGTAESLVNLNPEGARNSAINAMTPTGQGGYITKDNITQATIWTGTSASYQSLNPAGATYSIVYGMAADRQVGMYRPDGSNRFHACIWSGSSGSVVDLHDYLPTGYTESQANDIKVEGTTIIVVGEATHEATGDAHAMIWQFIEEVNFDFTLNKTVIAGQNSVQGTIALAVPRAAPTTFATYDDSSLVTTPPSVTLPATTTIKNFQITTTAVNSSINTTIYARYQATTISRPLTLAPLVPTALAFTPNPVTGGQTVMARVVINGVAGPSGRVIAVFDSSPDTTMPSTVTVPAGATQVIFPIETRPVTTAKVVTVTARVSAGEKTGTFRINP